MNRKGMLFLLLPLLTYLILAPADAFTASCHGVNLWFHTVLPSLLPFMILSNFLIGTGLISRLLSPMEPLFRKLMGLSCEGAYAWILGMFCGYPMGARLTAELYRDGRIDRDEACYLLTFANHASPAFLSTYVVLSGFGDPAMTWIVYLILYLSDFCTSLIFRVVFHRFGLSSSVQPKKEVPKQSSYGNLLDTSIMNGFEVITRLGGYIILFSILSGMILLLPNPLRLAAPFLSGITEITTGIQSLAASALSREVKTIAILTCTAFGGISTAAQTNCMIRESGLPFGIYLKGKLCCAAAAGIFSLLFIFLIV